MSCESTHTVFDTLCNLCKAHAGLNPLLRPLTHLAMGFGAMAIVREEVIIHAIKVPFLLVGSTIEVLTSVVADFAGRVGIVWE